MIHQKVQGGSSAALSLQSNLTKTNLSVCSGSATYACWQRGTAHTRPSQQSLDTSCPLGPQQQTYSGGFVWSHAETGRQTDTYRFIYPARLPHTMRAVPCNKARRITRSNTFQFPCQYTYPVATYWLRVFSPCPLPLELLLHDFHGTLFLH